MAHFWILIDFPHYIELSKLLCKWLTASCADEWPRTHEWLSVTEAEAAEAEVLEESAEALDVEPSQILPPEILVESHPRARRAPRHRDAGNFEAQVLEDGTEAVDLKTPQTSPLKF